MVKRIALFLPSLSDGGAERVMLNIATGLAQQHPDVDVDLVLASRTGPYLDQVPPEVRVVDLEAGRISAAALPLRRYIARERPDAMISALDPANLLTTLISRTVRDRPRVIVTEHCDFSSAVEAAKASPRRVTQVLASVLPRLVRAIYPLSAEVVAVSEGVADDLAETTGLDRASIEVVGNPVINDSVRAKAQAHVEHRFFDEGVPVVLGIGRLSYQKNFEPVSYTHLTLPTNREV